MVDEALSEAEGRGNAALMEALNTPWLDSTLTGTLRDDLLHLARKCMSREMVAIYHGVSTGLSTKEQLSTALLLMRCIPASTAFTDARDNAIFRERLVEAVMAPGVHDSTLVKAVMERGEKLISMSLEEFHGGGSHGEALRESAIQGLSPLVKQSSRLSDNSISRAIVRSIREGRISQEMLRSTMHDVAFSILKRHSLIGDTGFFPLALLYLGQLQEAYSGKESALYDSPQFIAHRSREFFSRSYPAIYTEFMEMAPGDRPRVAKATELILSHCNGGNAFMEELLDALPYLTASRLVEFSTLVEEYNLEWALASFDWAMGKSSLGRIPEAKKE